MLSRRAAVPRASLLMQPHTGPHLFLALPLLRRQPPKLLRVSKNQVQMAIKSHEPAAKKASAQRAVVGALHAAPEMLRTHRDADRASPAHNLPCINQRYSHACVATDRAQVNV
eukprot:364508-Chlamydomonas_euryale.AAC.6